MAQPNSRPFGITLLTIYGALVGVGSIAGGLFMILDHGDSTLLAESSLSSAQVLAGGIVAVVVGGVQVLLALALSRANNLVRILYSVVAGLNLVAGLWAVIALNAEQQASGIVTATFSGLVLYLLFNQRADRFFGTR